MIVIQPAHPAPPSTCSHPSEHCQLRLPTHVNDVVQTAHILKGDVDAARVDHSLGHNLREAWVWKQGGQG